MRPKRSEVIAAALAFTRSSNSQDQMFAFNFNEKVSFGLPEDTLSTDEATRLREAISGIAADGRTALYDAVAAGLERLEKENRESRASDLIAFMGEQNAT